MFRLGSPRRWSVLMAAVGLAVVLSAAVAPASAAPVGTALTYQGELELAGVLVDDTCDFEFSLWDDPLAALPHNQVGSTLSETLMVEQGRLTATLDFGENIFTGNARWLEIAVCCPAPCGPPATLSPRQQLTTAPYALHARGTTAVLNVKDYGATGNGSQDDRGAIQSAINAVGDLLFCQGGDFDGPCTDDGDCEGGTCEANGGVVYFPPGRYRLESALRAEVDNLTLLGSSGAVLVSDPPAGEQFPEAILVNKGSSPPSPVRHVKIQNLTIDVKNGAGGAQSVGLGVIQLNHCLDCIVDGIHMRFVGSPELANNTDGIATSQGTTGRIQNCIVDGIPKVGIYISAFTHHLIVDACEVKNCDGGIGGGGGISIAGCDRITVSNCRSHDNGELGMLIDVNGTDPPTPSTNIQVVGGDYSNNGFHGIVVQSAFDGFRPEHIQLIGVSAFDNTPGHGIKLEAGWDVLIASPTAAGNGQNGIYVDNRLIGPSSPRTARIQINNPKVYNNGTTTGVFQPGIALLAAADVTITGGTLYNVLPAESMQKYGIGLFPDTANDAVSTNVRIVDVDASLGHIQSVIALNENASPDPTAAAESGYYQIQDDGDPEGLLAAPEGSEYVDLSTGIAHRKTGAADSTTGWVPAGGVWTQNASAIFYDAGNVGIGTSDPDNRFTVDLGGMTVKDTSASALGKVQIGRPATDPGIAAFADNGHRRDIRFGDGGISLLTNSASGIPNFENGIIIDESGNVGVGTGAASAALEVGDGVSVAGIVIPNGGICVDTQGTCSAPAGGIRVGAAGIVGPVSSGEDVLIVPTGPGNVGIGTNSPSGKLEVAGASGNSSVILPAGAISAPEMLDEPGVAGAYTTSNLSLDETIQTLLSKTIYAPSGGYVLAIATARFSLDHVTGGYTNFGYGISSLQGCFCPGGTSFRGMSYGPDVPSGNYSLAATAHGIFSVGAGANIFHFVAREDFGDVTASYPQLILAFFPTDYETASSAAAPPTSYSLGREDEAPHATEPVELPDHSESQASRAADLQRELTMMRVQLSRLEQKLAHFDVMQDGTK